MFVLSVHEETRLLERKRKRECTLSFHRLWLSSYSLHQIEINENNEAALHNLFYLTMKEIERLD